MYVLMCFTKNTQLKLKRWLTYLAPYFYLFQFVSSFLLWVMITLCPHGALWKNQVNLEAYLLFIWVKVSSWYFQKPFKGVSHHRCVVVIEFYRGYHFRFFGDFCRTSYYYDLFGCWVIRCELVFHGTSSKISWILMHTNYQLLVNFRIRAEIMHR